MRLICRAAAKDALKGLQELVGLEALGDKVNGSQDTSDTDKVPGKQPELTADSLHQAVMLRQSITDYRAKRADPKADHATRYGKSQTAVFLHWRRQQSCASFFVHRACSLHVWLLD